MLHLNEVIEEYAKLLFEPLAAFYLKKIKEMFSKDIPHRNWPFVFCNG